MIDGILLLDKPLGLSSTAASQRVRRLLNVAKAGHVGSLDPLASGMLPICLGEATKLAGEVLEGAKVYRFRIRVGQRTTTGDTEGGVIETLPVPELQADALLVLLQKFLGNSLQIPPMYSALKRDGQPLYKLARAGLVVPRQARPIHIEQLDLLGYGNQVSGENWIECRVACGKGTYVRVLAEDICLALGTCGHVDQLRRERVLPFPSEAMQRFEDIEAALAVGQLPVLLGPEVTVAHLPQVTLSEDLERRLRLGQSVTLPQLQAELGQTVQIWGATGRFLGLGRVSAPLSVAPKRLVAQQASE